MQADKTAASVSEIFSELSRAAGTNPAAADLQMGKDNVLKSLAGNFETSGATADSLVMLPRHGFAADYWQGYPTGVEALTAEQVGASARRYFQPQQFLVVVVGPRSLEVPGADGKTTTVDVVGDLKALGFDLEDRTPAGAEK